MLAGEKGVQYGGMTMLPVSAKQNAKYDENHLYDMYGTQGDGAVHQDYSFTQLAAMLTGKAYTPSAKGKAVQDALEKRLSDYKQAEASGVTGTGLDLALGKPLNYEDFGYDNHDAMLRDSKGVVSSQFGTLQHATMEHANKIFNALSGIRNKFGEGSDIAKRIDDITANGLNYSKIMELNAKGGLADMLEAESPTGDAFGSEIDTIRTGASKLSGLAQMYRNTLGLLGIGAQGISNDFSNLDSVSNSIFKYLHSGNG
jgi:hypothetical protein